MTPTKRKAASAEEIGKWIDAHLKRFEKDPSINTVGRGGIHRFFLAGSHGSKGWVTVSYINFQGYASLRPQEAQEYLDWLDDGNIGTHYRMRVI